MSEENIIKQQDEIIGRLTRENEHLQDSISKSHERLRNMKIEAGFNTSMSFDIVWEKMLYIWKKNT